MAILEKWRFSKTTPTRAITTSTCLLRSTNILQLGQIEGGNNTTPLASSASTPPTTPPTMTGHNDGSHKAT